MNGTLKKNEAIDGTTNKSDLINEGIAPIIIKESNKIGKK